MPQDAAQSQQPKESQNFRAPVGNDGGESISRSSTTVLRLHGSRDWARAAAERERGKHSKMSQTAARAADVEKMKMQMMQVWKIMDTIR